MHARIAASLAAIALFPALCPTPADAGAWTQEKDKGLLALSATYYGTSEYFDANGELQPQRHFGKRELNAYGEWGLTDTLTVGTNLFLSDVEQANSSNISISNTELFLRQRVYKDDTRVISLQPLIKLPTISEHDRIPRGGSKSADIELGILYGENLDILSPRDFSDMLGAIRYRSDGLSPQLRYESRIGLYLTEDLLVMPAFYVTQSINPKTDPFVESGDLDYALMKAELSLAYTLGSGDYVQLSAFDHIAGTLTGSGRGFTLGYGMRF